MPRCVQRTFILAAIFDRQMGSGARSSEAAMRTPLLIVLTAVVLVTGSTLAILNNACKSSRHSWCAPVSGFQHHARTGRG
jgi:hypothetical protein